MDGSGRVEQHLSGVECAHLPAVNVFPPPFIDQHEVRAGVRMQRLRQETMRADPATPFIVSALIDQLLAVGSRQRAAPDTPRPPWLAAVIDHIGSSLGDPLSVTELASRANISPSHLAHAFPRVMGCTVGAYIRVARIRAAAAALREPGLSIQEIAYRTGFYDQAHLCRAFKAAHGVTPGDYRTTVLPRGDRAVSAAVLSK